MTTRNTDDTSPASETLLILAVALVAALALLATG